ncbi:MAG: alpha/beta hydrolase [Clostridia bacterium]|nr:alpha/beta hydrolase [Clostridia bacterium]
MEYQIKTTFQRVGRRVPGVLYEPEGLDREKLPTVLVMHSDEDYLDCPTGPELAKRGFRVLCANPMTKEGMFFSLAEKLSAVQQAMDYLRNLDRVGSIFLLGHSGGATLMTAYQAVAEEGPEIFRAGEMVYPYDGPEKLPPADGVILPDANWGNAVMQLFSLDPAVVDEDSGKKLDPYYDLFAQENGFREEGSTFSAEFVHRFLERQGERNNDILEYARARLRMIQEGKGRYSDDEPLVIPGANQGFFNNKLYAQDVRLMAHTAKPQRLLHPGGKETVEIVRSLREPENPVSLTHSLVEGGRIMTIRNYLSSYAVRTQVDYGYDEERVWGIDWHSTFASPVGNVEHIHVPMLLMGMTAGWEFLAAEEIERHAASQDRELIFIEGATHKFTPKRVNGVPMKEYGDTIKTMHDYLAGWLARRK